MARPTTTPRKGERRRAIAGSDQRQLLVRRNQHIDRQRADEERKRHPKLDDEFSKPADKGGDRIGEVDEIHRGSFAGVSVATAARAS